MKLEEKIAYCSGADFWHTKRMKQYELCQMTLSDGPNGVRKQADASGTDMLGINNSKPATCYPSASLTACSFDSGLTWEIGQAIGEEAYALDVDILLGPGANLKRNPLCGRNFEYFSEDPYLSGKMSAGFIRGVESTHAVSCLKHFACNNQETSRFNSDSIVDERTLRELYLRSFEIAVNDGNPSCVMAAYNKVNGVHCSDSKKLIKDILRDEWRFYGTVVTDWGGLNDRIEAFKAGCDLSMPGGSDYMEKAALEAVKNGTLSEKDIDASVRRISSLTAKKKYLPGMIPRIDKNKYNDIARKAAENSAVLLKNESDILPLKCTDKVVLIGSMAEKMRFQGSGSSHINPSRVISPCDAMPDLEWEEGCWEDGSADDEMISYAAEAAKQADVAVIFAGLPSEYESEGFDRTDMKMPEGQLRLIDAVTDANKNTVVVLFCGAPVECPWADKVKGILYMGLPGQEGGTAVKNILFGEVNPSGKLAETWPMQYSDCASSEFYAKGKDALYCEGIYVGYRYYDKAQVPVRFPFGYGLSYTTFEYSDLTLDGLKVKCKVTNTGSRAGAEVVQLWIYNPADGIHRPVREFRGFDKVFLKPSESTEVIFFLTGREFEVWSDGWKRPKGSYRISVGPLSLKVALDGVNVPVPAWQNDTWYAECKGKPEKTDLEKVLGHTISENPPRKGHYTMDNSIIEMKQTSLIMKIMFRAVESTVAKGFGGQKDYSNPDFRMMINSSAGAPLRSMQISGAIKGGLFEGLLLIANGHFFKGLGKMLFSKG